MLNRDAHRDRDAPKSYQFTCFASGGLLVMSLDLVLRHCQIEHLEYALASDICETEGYGKLR